MCGLKELKKKLIIHIGDAKTGTSSIQKFLSENKQELSELGVLYPETGLWSAQGIAHHRLAVCLNPYARPLGKDRDDPQEIYGRLRREIGSSGCSSAIVSSEGFCSFRDPASIRSLADAVCDFNVTIVAYVRRPDLWVESWYSQVVKGPPFSRKRFPEFLKICQDPSLKVIADFVRVFGKSSVILRPFDKRKLYQNDLISDFLEVNSVDIRLPERDSINISPCVEVTEILRQLNAAFDVGDGQRTALNNYLVGLLPGTGNKRYFTCAGRKEYLAKYQTVMQELESLSNTKGYKLFDDIDPCDDGMQEFHELDMSDYRLDPIVLIEVIKFLKNRFS